MLSTPFNKNDLRISQEVFLCLIQFKNGDILTLWVYLTADTIQTHFSRDDELNSSGKSRIETRLKSIPYSINIVIFLKHFYFFGIKLNYFSLDLNNLKFRTIQQSC